MSDLNLVTQDMKELTEKFQNLGSSVISKQREELETQLHVFQAALLAFKNEHVSEIVQNEEVRTQFSEICIAFGIDLLVVASSLSSNTDNNSERRSQLCLKIIEICDSTRHVNGGLILLKDLLDLINTDTWVNQDLNLKFTTDDISDALNHLQVLGNELELIKIGKHQYVKNIPQDLNTDQSSILNTADVLGYVSISILRDNFGWKKVRCTVAIDELVSNGILWLDIREGHETKYWITSWINKNL